jgi:hypothetical protein
MFLAILGQATPAFTSPKFAQRSSVRPVPLCPGRRQRVTRCGQLERKSVDASADGRNVAYALHDGSSCPARPRIAKKRDPSGKAGRVSQACMPVRSLGF